MGKGYGKKIVGSEFIILLGILILAVLFRLYKLRTAPDWYQDEGEFVHLANYLSTGNFDFSGIRNSMLLIGRPPMFLWVLAGLFKLFGQDILVSRSLAVLCSLSIIILSFIFVQQSLGRKSAFYTALLLAIMPEYIFYNRMGFTYNWTSLWMLFSVFALWRYTRQDSLRWLVTACLSAGVAFASDYLGIIIILVIAFVLILFRPKHLWAILLAGIPFIIAVLPTFVNSPSDAWYFLRSSFAVVKNGGENVGYQLSVMLQAYPQLFQHQPWIIVGIIGLFLLPDTKLRGITLFNLSAILVFFSFTRSLAAHYLLPIWPLVIIGLGFFLEKTVTYFFTIVKASIISLKFHPHWMENINLKSFVSSITSTVMVFAFVFLPISYMLILDIRGFLVEPLNPSSTMIEVMWQPLYVTAADAQAIAGEISKNLKPNDLVIAPDFISWMIPCNTADIRVAYAYELTVMGSDKATFNKERFTRSSFITDAKYIIIHNTWHNWYTSFTPEYARMMDKVSIWPMLMEKAGFEIYCNPSFCQ